MSLFQRSFYGEDPTFTNLFRMLDDFENYSREVQGSNTQVRGRGRHVRHRVFNPKFDVRETETTYELHGELPGVSRENLQIEFTEPQTMIVRGRIERNYSAGNPAAELVEDSETSSAVTENTEHTENTENTENSEGSHKATVSDEEMEAAKENGEVTTEKTAEVVKKDEPAQPAQPRERYWHQERTIGEFHRTFNFPARVDESGVSANLNNGVLQVSVPKAAKHETRRIAVN